MFPILFTIGPFIVYTFGVMLVLGFVVATLFSARGILKEGGDPKRFWDVAFLLLLGGILGARLHYVLNNSVTFYHACLNPHLIGLADASCFEALKIWKGGLAWFGGFVLANVFGITYLLRHKINPWPWADIIVPSAYLGLAVGRIGCFSAADDFGKPTDLPWAMSFPNLQGYPDMENVPIHPAQLYMLIKDVIVFWVGYHWLRKKKQFHGQVAFTCLALHSALRLLVEVFRGDYRRGFIFEWDVLPPIGADFLSNAQLLALLLIPFSLFMLHRLRRSPSGVPSETTTVNPYP